MLITFSDHLTTDTEIYKAAYELIEWAQSKVAEDPELGALDAVKAAYSETCTRDGLDFEHDEVPSPDLAFKNDRLYMAYLMAQGQVSEFESFEPKPVDRRLDDALREFGTFVHSVPKAIGSTVRVGVVE